MTEWLVTRVELSGLLLPYAVVVPYSTWLSAGMSVVQVTVAVVGFGLTFTLLMTGTTRYSYVHAQVPDCVSGLVTTTLTVPAACALVVPVRVVLVTVTAVRATPPTVAVAPVWKLAPLIVTAVPPVVGPLAGEIELTEGAAEAS